MPLSSPPIDSAPLARPAPRAESIPNDPMSLTSAVLRGLPLLPLVLLTLAAPPSPRLLNFTLRLCAAAYPTRPL